MRKTTGTVTEEIEITSENLYLMEQEFDEYGQEKTKITFVDKSEKIIDEEMSGISSELKPYFIVIQLDDSSESSQDFPWIGLHVEKIINISEENDDWVREVEYEGRDKPFKIYTGDYDFIEDYNEQLSLINQAPSENPENKF